MKYSLRKWNTETQSAETVEMTFEEIIMNPFMLYSNDITYALLTELRSQYNLEPLHVDKDAMFGEFNGK